MRRIKKWTVKFFREFSIMKFEKIDLTYVYAKPLKIQKRKNTLTLIKLPEHYSKESVSRISRAIKKSMRTGEPLVTNADVEITQVRK